MWYATDTTNRVLIFVLIYQSSAIAVVGGNDSEKAIAS